MTDLDRMREAIYQSQWWKVKDLLAAGADPNGVDRDKSHLELAIDHESLSAVVALLDAGADVNARGILANETPLYRAVRQRCEPAVVAKLCERGADVAAVAYHGLTPLHAAAVKDYASLVIICGHGADVNVADEDGITPLHRAVAVASTSGCSAVAYLCEHGAEVNARDSQWRTPLHNCAAAMERDVSAPVTYGDNRKYVNAAYILAEHGADLNAADAGGNTALHLAINGGDDGDDGDDGDGDDDGSGKRVLFPALVPALLALGADPTIRNAAGMTPGDLTRALPQEVAEVAEVAALLAAAEAARAQK